jgi:hypothetical protein
MSKHLIQTIEVEGGKRCVKHGASTPKWRTVSFPSIGEDGEIALGGVEDDDQWVLTTDEFGNGDGQIKFATCCLWKATIRLTFSGLVDPYRTLRLSINGTLIQEFVDILDSDMIDPLEIEVDLDALGLLGRPCGNIWLIEFSTYEGGDTGYVTIEVVDVTFGPTA